MTNFVECDRCNGTGREFAKDPKTQRLHTEDCKKCGGSKHLPMPEETHIQERPDRVRAW